MRPFLNLDTLAIEVTRRCNMACAHCMRGDAQDKDLDVENYLRLMPAVNSINSLVPTGGEVSLVPHILKRIAKVHPHNAHIGSVFIATNGKRVTNDVLQAYMDLLMITDWPDAEDSLSQIALSTDPWHEYVPRKNISKLSLLRAFDKEGKEMRPYKGTYTLLNLGRAKTIKTAYSIKLREPTDTVLYEIDDYKPNEPYLFLDTLTLTVDGDLLPRCDYSYDEIPNIRITNVKIPDWELALAKWYLSHPGDGDYSDKDKERFLKTLI